MTDRISSWKGRSSVPQYRNAAVARIPCTNLNTANAGAGFASYSVPDERSELGSVLNARKYYIYLYE